MPIQPFPVRIHHFLTGTLLVLLVGASSAVAAPPEGSAGTSASTSAAALAAIQIDNFGRVDPHLYRGAQPRGRDFADLKALGIKTIVNLTSDDADPRERALAEAAGLAYVAIPMSTRIVPTAAQVAQFLGLVNDPAGEPVYVHCVGGRHRTGVMTAIYRMTHDGWSGEQAFQEMKRFKFGADFLHPEFKEFVFGFRPEPGPESVAIAANAAAQH